MKVKDLIKELENFDLEKDVYIWDDEMQVARKVCAVKVDEELNKLFVEF